MEQHGWLVSVLNDLETYAEKNDLPWLMQELSRTKKTAIAEVNESAKLLGAVAPGNAASVN